MTQIEFKDGAFDVDAALIARGLGLEAAQVPGLIRSGRIGSGCERGEAEDAGRYRLTFVYGERRLRLIVDGHGNLLGRSDSP